MTFRRRSPGRSAASSSASASARLCLSALVLALAAGCGNSSTAAQHSMAPAVDPSGCFRTPGHPQIAGELVNIPRKLPERPPLGIAPPGLRGAATWLAGQTDFDDVGAKHGFVVAYPNALEAQRWQLAGGDRDV